MSRRHVVVGLFALLAVGTVPASAAASGLAGRPLVEVLREMQDDGLNLLYSSDLVHPQMKVVREPAAGSVQGILEELLGPHGLAPQIGPRGHVLVVRREPAPIVVTLVRPLPDQAAIGEIEVAVEVTAEEPVTEVVLLVDDHPVRSLRKPPFEAVVDLGEGSADRRVTARAVGAWGGVGSDSVMTRRVEFIDSVSVALKQLYVTVTRNGSSLTDLDEGEFTLWDDGIKQKLVTFGGGDVPLTAAVLLDVSESMKGRELETALAGSKAFLARLGELDRAMVMLFSDRPLAVTPFGPYHEGLVDELHFGPGAGGTALNDHLYVALRLLDREQGRRVIVLLSDGADVSSVLGMREILWKVRRSDALIYWIRLRREVKNFSSAWRDAEENRREQEGLEQAVKNSGGRIVALADIEHVAGAFDEILGELRAQYVLGYYPQRRADGAWREVRVFLSRPRAAVRMRRGYVDE